MDLRPLINWMVLMTLMCYPLNSILNDLENEQRDSPDYGSPDIGQKWR